MPPTAGIPRSCPACVGQLHEVRTASWGAALTCPCPLAAALWKAGRTTFFWHDFCPCLSIPADAQPWSQDLGTLESRARRQSRARWARGPATRSHRDFTKLGPLPEPQFAYVSSQGTLPTWLCIRITRKLGTARPGPPHHHIRAWEGDGHGSIQRSSACSARPRHRTAHVPS